MSDELTLDQKLEQLRLKEEAERRKLEGLQMEAEERRRIEEEKEKNRVAEDEEDGFLNNAKEVVFTMTERAIERAVRWVGDLTEDEDDEPSSYAGLKIGSKEYIDPEGTGAGFKIPGFDVHLRLTGDEQGRILAENYKRMTGTDMLTARNFDLPDTDRPDSVAGQVAAEIGGYLLTFAATRKITGMSGWKGGLVNGAIADFIYTDTEAGNLASTLERFGQEGDEWYDPVLDNAITQFLSVDEDDEAMERRLKTALEGSLLGTAAEGVFWAVKALKASRVARRKAHEDAALRESAEAGPQAEVPVVRELDESDRVVSAEGTLETRFEVVETEGGGLRVSPKESAGDLDASLDITVQGDEVQIIYPQIEKAAQGQGLGVEMYIEAAEYALSRGLTLASDRVLSIQARRIWPALERRGYIIERAMDLNPPNARGQMSTVDGGPMFRVVGKQGAESVRVNRQHLDILDRVLGDAAGRASDALAIGGRMSRMIDEMPPEQLNDTVDRLVDLIEGKPPRPGPDGTPVSTVIDPARINWDDMGRSAGDMVELFEKVVRYNMELFAAAGRKVPLKDMKAVAARLAAEGGDDPVELLKSIDLSGNPGEAAARQAAGALLVDASAQRITDLAAKIRAGDGGFETRKLLEVQITRHQALMALQRSNASEAARLMRMQRELVSSLNAHDDTFREIIRDLGRDPESSDIIRELGNVMSSGDVSRIVKSTQPGKWTSRFFTYFYGQLLSNPTSWVANTLGPALEVVWRGAFELPTAVAIGAVRKSFGSAADVVTTAQLRASWAGVLTGAQLAVRFPLRHFFGTTKGFNRFKPAELKKYIDEHNERIGTVYRRIATGEAQTRSSAKFDQRMYDGSFELPPQLADDASVYRRMMNGFQYLGATTGNMFNKLWKIPGGVFGATDELFTTIAYHQKWAEDAVHYAEKQLKYGIADGTVSPNPGAQKVFYEGELANAMNKDGPLRYLLQQNADAHAAKTVFQSPLGEKSRPLMDMVAKNPWLRVFVPFVRTPTNIFKQSFAERTLWPLITPFQSKGREALMNGGREADELLAKVAVGSTLMMGAGLYAAAGNVTGSGVKGYNSEDLKGIKPYSIKLGDKWYQYNRLEPLGMLIGFAADLSEAAQAIIEAPESEENDGYIEQLGLAAEGILFGAVENMFSKTYLQGINDLVGAMSGDKWALTRIKESLGFSLLVPGGAGLRSLGATIDPYAREAFDWMDKLKAQIPLVRQTMPIKRDWLGRKVKTSERWGLDIASPIMVHTESKDILDRELARLKFPTNPMNKTVRGGVPLTAKEYEKLLELRGQHKFGKHSLESYLRELINSKWYRNPALSDEGRIEAITRAAEKYGEVARKKLIEDSEDLQKRIIKHSKRQQDALSRLGGGEVPVGEDAPSLIEQWGQDDEPAAPTDIAAELGIN